MEKPFLSQNLGLLNFIIYKIFHFIKCIIKFYGNNALSLNDDGTYSVGLSDKENIRQQWIIKHIPNSIEYLNNISRH